MTTVGCILPPYGNPPSRLLPFARTAEAAGLDELWLWEDCFLESGIASAAAILGGTERIAVGIGVMPVPLRNVALTAMESATLEGAFPGRFLPGVGHGVQHWMAQVGARVDSPLTLLREQVTALRALLAGDRVTTSGRYVTLDDVALDWPPASPPPVLSAATGPKTLRLVGEVADGAVLVADTGLEGVRRAVTLLDEGRAAAVRDEHRAVRHLPHEPQGLRSGRGRQHGRGRGGRRAVTLLDEGRAAAGLPPLAESGPGSAHPFRLVANLAAATGPDAVERLRRACEGWNLDVADDAALAEYGSWGSAEELADGLRRFADAGVHSLVVQPTLDEPDLDGFAQLLGKEVAPLLR
jgi:alkanesulfonate monooxygenase SsuD/methylene tetrahydromethanopterin reductase-like flavin-dependent oxidoreductase (luciferase family)